MKKIKNILRNERGLTLIELLAVVVILAIIAAIAIPSIAGLMDNTKKDAHVANAQQMISSTRLAITADQSLTNGTIYVPLKFLEAQNYLEPIKDPDKTTGGYTAGALTITKTDPAPAGSYVVVTDGKIIGVKLINAERGIKTTDGGAVNVDDIKRESVIE